MRTTIFTSMLMLLMSLNAHQVNAQTDSDKHNYVILTKKVPQLQPILISAAALKQEDGSNFGQFEVIICGQEIGDITDPEKINKFLAKAESLGVTLVACGFSLNKFNVDRSKVPKQMKIVENGILYNLQLQKRGYYSLGL